MLKKSNEDGFDNTKKTISKAGQITKEAIEKVEKEIGDKVVTKSNFKHLNTPKKQKQLLAKKKKGLNKNQLNRIDKSFLLPFICPPIPPTRYTQTVNKKR